MASGFKASSLNDQRQDLTVMIKASGRFPTRSGFLVAGKKKGGGTKKGNGFDNIKLKDLMCMIQGITTARMMVISSKMSGE